MSLSSGAVESEICPGFKGAVGVTPADFLGNLNNVGVPEALDKSLVEIRDLLSRHFQQSMPSVRYHCPKKLLLLHGV